MATAPTTTYPLPQSSGRKQQQQQQRRLFRELDWNRSDGRGFHQCRPAFFRTGAASAASGSAYAEFGTTKVIVSVKKNLGDTKRRASSLYLQG